MEILVESFPLAFGVLLGLSWLRYGGPQEWRVAWGVASIALGSFATLASGEWRVSMLYFAFDIGLVAAVSLGVVFLRDYLRRRSASR